MRSGPASRPAFGRNRAWAMLRTICLPVFLLFMPVVAMGVDQTADTYGGLLDGYLQSPSEPATRPNPESKWTAAQWREYDLETALKKEATVLSQESLPAPELPPISHRNAVLLAVALLLGVSLTLRSIAQLMNCHFNPWSPSAALRAFTLAKVRAEEDALSEFVRAFQLGPAASSGASTLASGVARNDGPLAKFLADAPPMLRDAQKLLQNIIAMDKNSSRHGLLADLQRELGRLKGAAAIPELLPVWQVATALEGLVKQLTQSANNITQSTLRTVAGGMDLLRELCTPDLRPDLLSNPPIRLLAVDDDLISRKAVALALKKALNPPDLAEHGEAALPLVTENTYDVIFLDVQMPGMDGFELCSRIHDTVSNATTPVVFVTCHSDFDARAQSVLCGGTDLIAKPFLTFEITVKALTLALQARLQGGTRSIVTNREAKAEALNTLLPPPGCQPFGSFWVFSDVARAELPAEMDTKAFHQVNLKADMMHLAEEQANRLAAKPVKRWWRKRFTKSGNLAANAGGSVLSSTQLLDAFLKRATVHLQPLRDVIQSAFRITDDQQRLEMLSNFFLRFNALVPHGLAPEIHPAVQMTVALEGLLKKMVGNPGNCTSSSLLTVATAVDLLIELSHSAVTADLANTPPVRLLVVDDDPVVRRAITGSLQMSFDKPDSVDNGAAALALAEQKRFDAIFMDVEMPGQDGFEVCLRIRKTELNRTTPVVFVTCHSDFKSRSQSAVSGGNDFMAKPFLPAEIKVKALTFVLKGRLKDQKCPEVIKPLRTTAEPEQREEALAVS